MVTILIVDDEREIQNVLKEYCIHEGFSVLLANDGYEALEQVEKNNVDFYREFRFDDCRTVVPHIQKRDNIKTEYCKDNNITLIRIPYWDFNNIENILKEKVFT